MSWRILEKVDIGLFIFLVIKMNFNISFFLVTHGCIVATVKLYLPDGKEAKARFLLINCSEAFLKSLF